MRFGPLIILAFSIIFQIFNYYKGDEDSLVKLAIYGIGMLIAGGLPLIWGYRVIRPVSIFENGMEYHSLMWNLTMKPKFINFNNVIKVHFNPTRNELRRILNEKGYAKNEWDIESAMSSIIFELTGHDYFFLSKYRLDSVEDVEKILKSQINEEKWQ